jgi:hypothetical protein
LRIYLFLSSEAFSNEEAGVGRQGDSEDPDGLVAEDPDYQSYRKGVSGSKEKNQTHGVFGNRSSMERILYAVFFHYNSKGREVPSFLFTQKN